MYQVIIYHHRKAWRRGDLEDELVLVGQENFKTRKTAKEFILKDLQHHTGTKRYEWHKGDDPSYAGCWTGNTWINENSGEEMEEFYRYELKKVKLK